MQSHRPAPKQSGFSVIEVLLIVLVVAALAGGGFVVYQHHKPNGTKNSAATNSSQSTGQQGTTSTQHSQTTPQYLTIKEWGVKLPLSSAINDAYYIAGVSSVGSDGVTNQVYIGLKSLDSYGCTAAGSNRGQDSALAMIFRTKPTDVDPVTSKTYRQLYPDGVTIGNYFYGFEGFNITNISTCKAPQGTIKSTDTAIATAAKGIVAATTVVKLPELGIQITVPDEIKDLTYKVHTGTVANGKQATFAFFSTATLTKLDAGCSPSSAPLGSLGRGNWQYPTSDPLAAASYGQLVKQFPTFYISAGWPQAACSKNASVNGTSVQFKHEFATAQSTIQQLN